MKQIINIVRSNIVLGFNIYILQCMHYATLQYYITKQHFVRMEETICWIF